MWIWPWYMDEKWGFHHHKSSRIWPQMDLVGGLLVISYHWGILMIWIWILLQEIGDSLLEICVYQWICIYIYTYDYIYICITDKWWIESSIVVVILSGLLGNSHFYWNTHLPASISWGWDNRGIFHVSDGYVRHVTYGMKTHMLTAAHVWDSTNEKFRLNMT